MNGCVNKNKEFYSLAKEHGIDGGELELIIHKYWNEGGKVDSFPSTLYISEQLGIGKTYYESGENVRKLWERDYSEPIIVNSESELSASVTKAKTFFPVDAITTYKDNKGNFVLRIAEPVTSSSIDKEIQDILAKASRDGQGRLLAPNGKPTNLTEKQYAQVRTRAFKKWFGDWTKITFDKNGNPIIPNGVSKVVDKNGEPLIVYHGTSRRLNNNSFNSEFIFASDNSIIGAGYAYQRKGFSIGIDYALSDFAGEDINSFRNYIEDLIKELETEIELGEDMPFYQEGDLEKKKNLMKELKKAKQEIKNRDIFKELEPNIFNLFQNIKNPLIVDAKGKYWHSIEFEGTTRNTNEIAKIAKDRGYDGLIITNVIDKGTEVSKNGEYAEVANDYIAFEPNQIKSATDNIGAFSTTNDRIDRFGEGKKSDIINK